MTPTFTVFQGATVEKVMGGRNPPPPPAPNRVKKNCKGMYKQEKRFNVTHVISKSTTWEVLNDTKNFWAKQLLCGSIYVKVKEQYFYGWNPRKPMQNKPMQIKPIVE